jgi:hypothetical protein|tara:strand:- start:1069 stop:1509 length:441 start_codon:yes stop_codon:yes gene_type:complete
MEEEFYAILKLTSGEEIFSLISIDENEDDPIIMLQNPITMKIVNSTNGLHVKVRSWMEMSSDSIFIIKPDKVITMTESHDERLIEIYTNYISDENDLDIYNSFGSTDDSSGKVIPSQKMGYISSVDDARKKLEDIFKLEVEDSKES